MGKPEENTDGYNCRLYNYPTGQHVTCYQKTISQGKTKENLTKTYQNENRSISQEDHCKNVSLNATKNKIYNIARSNTWDWFITLTFDRSLTDSSNYDIIVKRLHKYLSNLQQRKCPDMKYLIVPELHADGIHYHFHGLLSGVENMQFKFSGLYDHNENPIFNIFNWKLGFTTATRVTDTNRVSSYITKYITKSSEQYLKEKRRFYASRNIERTQAEYCLVDESEFQQMYQEDITYVKTINVPQALQQITYYELN